MSLPHTLLYKPTMNTFQEMTLLLDGSSAAEHLQKRWANKSSWFKAKILFHLFYQGKLKYKERVTEGFDNMFDAFAELFTGVSIGKAVVKA